MKTYLLFAGDNHYPDGGISDYRGDFNSVDDAIDYFQSGEIRWLGDPAQYTVKWDWYQIVQSNDMTLVTNGYRRR